MTSKTSISALLIISMVTMSSAGPILTRLRRSVENSEPLEDTANKEPQKQPAKAIGFLGDTSKTNEGFKIDTKYRKNKSLGYFDYVPQFFATDDDYGDDELTIESKDDSYNNNNSEDEDDISRTLPSRRKQNPYKDFSNTNALGYENSPIYYIRLPPTPYMFVPGLGYVSNPPSIGPPVPPPVNPFINLPIDFVSNGKPTTVYQWNGSPAFHQPPPPPPPSINTFNPVFGRPQRPQRPSYQNGYQKPQSVKKPILDINKVTNLDKGPYVFNGKPNDIFVLRDSYNSLYSDALQNFYP